eukprot:1156426-Pelagomonas_calceolata.AAC.4
MASQAPGSRSNPLARWLKPVNSTQHLLADRARQANAKAAREGKPAAQKNPVGRPPGESVVAAALVSNWSKNVPKPLQPPAPEQQQGEQWQQQQQLSQQQHSQQQTRIELLI